MQTTLRVRQPRRAAGCSPSTGCVPWIWCGNHPAPVVPPVTRGFEGPLSVVANRGGPAECFEFPHPRQLPSLRLRGPSGKSRRLCMRLARPACSVRTLGNSAALSRPRPALYPFCEPSFSLLITSSRYCMHDCTILESRDSTMIRTSGSVPDGLTRTRPFPSRSA